MKDLLKTNIYEICLEQTHINMAITKIGGMISIGKIRNLIFATVDKLLHCIQLHYVRDELERMIDIKDINIKNYVVVDDELIEIDSKTIKKSKNLSELRKV